MRSAAMTPMRCGASPSQWHTAARTRDTNAVSHDRREPLSCHLVREMACKCNEGAPGMLVAYHMLPHQVQGDNRHVVGRHTNVVPCHFSHDGGKHQGSGFFQFLSKDDLYTATFVDAITW